MSSVPHQAAILCISKISNYFQPGSFIYGGLNRRTKEIYREVYVLTIPGFVWFKAPNANTAGRHLHSCELVKGNQFLSIGGFKYQYWLDPDSFTQGIGVFDMSTMVWKSSYDADAPPYQSPTVVKEWYSSG